MEREISSGATLGIVLLALAAVIGLGFGVFAIAKGIANEGTVNVQDSLSTVSSQVFLDYDQKIITGTQAASALKNFEGKPYAVLVSTKALQGNQAIAPTADHPTAYVAQTGTGSTAIKYLNYNAVLQGTASGGTGAVSTLAGGGAVNSVTNPAVQMTLTNGVYVHNTGFYTPSGEIKFDNATGGINKSGNAEYIPSNTKFQANVIKDTSGAYLGIVLRQL